MQYVWQHRLWLPSDMKTVDGVRVDVLDPGLLNTGSGPDFFNAKIRIGDRLWAGNVEIHVRASDWHRHGHDSDAAYDSVVLHVVEHDDTRICRTNGETIEQLVMPCAADFSKEYHAMVNNPAADLMCAGFIDTLPRVYLTDWFAALAYERLYMKADRVERYLKLSGGDWDSAIYITLARALGFGTNSEPFERLAIATPLRAMMRHYDSPELVEGALFGQAGLLEGADEGSPEHDYCMRLAAEHDFFTRKYDLAPVLYPGWKTGRMRPQNQPHRRIAALAAMVCRGFDIGRRIFAITSVDDARALFDINLSPFWSKHFSFATEAPMSQKAFSASSVNTLLINVVAPLLHAYGSLTGRSTLCEKATDLLQALPPENNMLVRVFTSSGIACDDALTSQAMVQLRNEYCHPRKCLYCRIGHRYLAQKALRRR